MDTPFMLSCISINAPKDRDGIRYPKLVAVQCLLCGKHSGGHWCETQAGNTFCPHTYLHLNNSPNPFIFHSCSSLGSIQTVSHFTTCKQAKNVISSILSKKIKIYIYIYIKWTCILTHSLFTASIFSFHYPCTAEVLSVIIKILHLASKLLLKLTLMKFKILNAHILWSVWYCRNQMELGW